MKALLLACLLAFPAFGDTVTLTWVIPTEGEVCSPAGPVGNIAGTRIWVMVAEIPAPATTYTLSGVPPGTYSYVSTAYTSDGQESRVSGAATKVVTSLTAKAGTSVKTVVRVDNGFLLLPAGVLSEDVTCDPANSVNGNYAVPVSSVTWTGTVRPQVVVAECI